jgi:hypothetical protein
MSQTPLFTSKTQRTGRTLAMHGTKNKHDADAYGIYSVATVRTVSARNMASAIHATAAMHHNICALRDIS